MSADAVGAAGNIAGILDPVVAADPDRVALVVDDRPCSYGELSTITGRWVASLAGVGVEAGQRVALADWGGVRSTAVTLAAAHLGAASAQMNPLLTATELGELVHASACSPVGIAADEARGSLRTALGPDAILLDAAEVADGAVPARAPGDEADALVLFTSGTTGIPKPIGVSHRALMARVQAYRGPFDATRPASVSLMCVPSFHVGGMLGLLVTLYGADTTVVLPRFDPGRWLEAVARHRVATAFLVPTMLARILDHPSSATTDLSSLRTISYGAAAAPASLIARAMDRWPEVGFANVFGQTETLGAYAALSAADHRDPKRVGSVGRPLPGVDVRVVDPATGDDLGAGEVGELWVRSGQTVADAGGSDWFATGDLAHRDEDGYLFPAGRRSDTINRGGEKFGPAEVADALRSHAAVAEVAVAGVPDPEMGERVGALVVLVEGAGAPSSAQLREWCATSVAPFKRPEVVVFVDGLPYNELGKIPRRSIIEVIENASAGHPERGRE